MNALHLIGRILFGILFAFNGINHFLQLDAMSQYVASKGVPAPGVVVALSGLLLLLGGLSVILGYKPKIGLWLLVVFLIPVALIMHNFWAVEGPQAQVEMAQFFKNISLAGASLALLLFTDRDWPYSVGGASTGTPAGGTPEIG